MIARRTLNIAFLILVIRIEDRQKVNLGARRPDGGMILSIMHSNLNAKFGKNGKIA